MNYILGGHMKLSLQAEVDASAIRSIAVARLAAQYADVTSSNQGRFTF